MKEDVNWELILHRLNEMSKNQESLSKAIESIEDKLGNVSSAVDAIQDIKQWKGNMEEAISTSELKDLKNWKKRI